MNTSAISSSSSVSASTGGGTSASQIQKQIAALQVKITKEQSSKDDAKTKVQLVEAYEEQIQELEAQLQQMQQAQQQKAQDTAQKTAAAGTGDETSQGSLTTEQKVEKKLNEPAPYDQKGQIIDATA